MLGVFVSGHKFYVCNLRTKHKICILANHNICFCVFVFLGMLHYDLIRTEEYVLYFGEFLIHDSHGFMILKNN